MIGRKLFAFCVTKRPNVLHRFTILRLGTCAVPAGRDCFGDFGGSVPEPCSAVP